MVHVIFDRQSSAFKVFASGVQQFLFEANGSAWGDGGPNAPYGHDCQISPGHYKLTQVERIDPPSASEGAGQIYVADLTGNDYFKLAATGKVKTSGAAQWSIGGFDLPVGMLTHYDRSEVMIHGGGSNLGVPACFDPMQPLCRTYGCTRLHNANLAQLMDFLEPIFAAQNQLVIYSVIGDSPELPQ